MESLIAFDRFLFLKINHDWTHPWLDVFFPAITDLHKNPWLFIPVILGILGYFYFRFTKLGLVSFLVLTTTLAISDFVGAKVVKPYFGRARPPEAGLDVVLRSPHYGGLSFTSNHAANIFCAAVFLSILFPKGRWLFIGIASLVAYSRVYCGVHFPLDVLFGSLQGTLIGFASALLLVRSNLNPFRGQPWQKS